MISEICSLISLNQRLGHRNTRGIVVLHNRGRRTIGQITQDVQCIVDIGEIDLARMLAKLE